MGAHRIPNTDSTSSSSSTGSRPSRSSLLINVIIGVSRSLHTSISLMVLSSTPFAASITISAESLTREHLEKAGADPETPVVGTEGGQEFTRAVVGDELEMDWVAAERDILDAGETLTNSHNDIGGIVLECTNMGPFAHALATHVSLPVFDITTFLTWFHAGLAPRRYPTFD